MPSLSTLAVFQDPRADIVLRSRQGGDGFAVRSLHLRAASSVFDGMMDLPVQDSAEEEDGKPVVLLEESPKALELYLRLIVGEEKMDLLETFEELMSVLPLAEKYESHLVLNLLLAHLRPHVYSHSKTIFPLACIHGHLTLAKRALEYFSGTAVVEKVLPSRSDFLTGRWSWQGQNASLDEIPKDLFERIPLKIVEKLQKLQARIAKGSLRWADVADELKFD